MKLIFLGAGGAFTVGQDNFQSNMLFENESGKKLLLDCGTDIRYSLYDIGYSYLDIKDIYISHLHLDHVGGLEYIGFSTKFDKHSGKPNIILHESLVYPLWENILSGCMKTLKGEEATLKTFFDVEKLKDNQKFIWDDVEFNLVKTIHTFSGDIIQPSYGLFFEINGIKSFITTDTQFTPELLMPYFEKADIIFHDCETSVGKSYVHANYEDLKTLPQYIKNKMWLYHYGSTDLPDSVSDGFKGFIKKGQEFNY